MDIDTWLYGKVPDKPFATANFARICQQLPWREKAPDENAGPLPATRAETERFVEETLEHFRTVLTARGLHVDLIELAVIDNKSLPQTDNPTPEKAPKFVSLVSAYGQSESRARCLLAAWHRAIGSLVNLGTEGKSIVGSVEAYKVVTHYQQVPHGRIWQVPTGGNPVTSRYWCAYPFGMTTAGSSAAENDVVGHISGNLCSAFRREIEGRVRIDDRDDNSDAVPWKLLVVPFRRPFPWTLNKPDRWALPSPRDERNERCGGCLFALVSPTTGDGGDINRRLQEAAVRCHWLLARAAMLEAHHVGTVMRGVDDSGFAHTVGKVVGGFSAPLGAADQICSQPLNDQTHRELKEKIRQAIVAATRLKEVAHAYRTVWGVINSGKSIARPFAVMLHDVEEEVKAVMEETFETIRNSVRDGKTKQSYQTAVGRLQFEVTGAGTENKELRSIQKDVLRVVLVEVAANAIQHGAWHLVDDGKLRIHLTWGSTLNPNHSVLYLGIANPVRHDEVDAVRELFRTDRVSLGLSALRAITGCAQQAPEFSSVKFEPSCDVDGEDWLWLEIPIGVATE